ncbi:FadR/GntR family transcriptional regulator [Kineococcus sp. SYSU DK002]|uniref:FadR/GntR family transcriptional regulator n=1 Tax=Kineococcus sp. SYSU DK002 TaxID=3383123 RepID=UPI003D7D71E8
MDTLRPAPDSEDAPSSRSQSEAVVQSIKQMLVSGELGPRARLPVEKELAARLGVSRGTLREGVRALAAMGVLETRQGDGTYVTSLDARLLLSPVSFVVDLQSADGGRQLQQVRRVLEVEAAGAAAMHVDAESLQRAEEVLRRFEVRSEGDADDHRRNMEIDIEFHRVLARASQNAVLEALIEALASRTVRGRMWRAIRDDGADERSHAEHRAILAAVVRRDAPAARILMGAHLLGVEQYLSQETSIPEDLALEVLAPGASPDAAEPR